MKQRLVVYNNKIVINDYKFGDLKNLERNFEIYNRATNSYINVAVKYDSKNKTMTIPRGVDIKYLENILGVYAFYDNSYIKPTVNAEPILLKYQPKDDTQVETIKFMLGQEKYSYTKNYSQLLIALGTGIGKTYLGISYIAFMNMKAIIITSSSGWLDQWVTRIQEHTNILSTQIHSIQGSIDISNLFDKNKNDLANRYKVYTVTHSTLLSYGKSNGWKSISKLFEHLGIGIKIYDEAHLNFENIYNVDYAANVYKTLYLTATPSRGDFYENKVFQLYFRNVPTIGIDNEPHTHYIALRYRSGLKAEEISECMDRYGFHKQSYCDKIVTKKHFDYISRIVFDMIEEIPGKKLLFFSTNQSIVFFYKWVLYNYPEYESNVGIYTSINPDKKDALNNTIILTTSASAGAAVDCSDVMVCINMAEPTKSPPQNKQRFGRTRAYNSYYIDLIDESTKICVKYYKESYDMFERYALSTKEVRFNNKELEDTAFGIMKKREIKYGCSPFANLESL